MDFDPKKNRPWLMPLRRWLSGEATHHDEQSLDSLATGDPFLADALEGYRSQPEANHNAAVTRLKASLRSRARKQRSAGFYLLRVAAAGAVLMAAWFGLQQFKQHGKPQQGMAETARVEPQSDTAEPRFETAPAPKTQTTSPEDAAGVAAAEDGLAPNPSSFSTKKATPPTAAHETETYPAQHATPDTGEGLATSKAEADAAPAMNEEIADAKMRVAAEAKIDAAQATADNFATNAQTKTYLPRQITGTITSESGGPLIGANILAKGTATGTLSGADGSYSIGVPAGVPALRFSYAGYAILEVQLGAETRLDVQLDEGSERLSEAVVANDGQVMQRKVISPKPQGGFKNLEKYILENMRRPDAGLQGEVLVRFGILPDGTLSDFQTTSTLGQAFQEEAVRLLREGPKWKGGPGARAGYTVRFE